MFLTCACLMYISSIDFRQYKVEVDVTGLMLTGVMDSSATVNHDHF